MLVLVRACGEEVFLSPKLLSWVGLELMEFSTPGSFFRSLSLYHNFKYPQSTVGAYVRRSVLGFTISDL